MKRIIFIAVLVSSIVNFACAQTTKNLKMNKALIIVDIQNDYFRKGTMPLVGSDEASENAKLLLERFRNDRLTIIHIQHIATDPTATFFIPNTDGAKINNNVKPIGQEKIIVKHYPNSFRETELLNYLTANNITDLTICGMMTHMCIDATTRAAYDLGFNCIVVGDACATKNLYLNGHTVKANDVQTAFLSALNGTYAEVKTTKDITEKK